MDIAFLLGAFAGTLLLVVVIPAVIAGLFSAKKRPSTGRLIAGWIVALIFAYGGYVGGGTALFQIVAVAILLVWTLWRTRQAPAAI